MNKILSFLLLFSTFSLNVIATGDVDSGGGDQYSQQFTEVAYDLVRLLKKEPIIGVDYNDLLKVIKSTRVVSKDELILDGHEVDFIKYPSLKLIEMSRDRWGKITDEYRRIRIVLHEYLGIMRIEDERYQVSGQLDHAKVCNASPMFRESVQLTLGKSCWRIIKDDLRHIERLKVRGVPFKNNEVIGSEFKNVRVRRLSFYSTKFTERSSLQSKFINPNDENDLFIQEPQGLINQNTFAKMKYVKNLTIQPRRVSENKFDSYVFERGFLKNMTHLETLEIFFIDSSSIFLSNSLELISILEDIPESIKKISLFGITYCYNYQNNLESKPPKEYLKVFNFLKNKGFQCGLSQYMIRP